MVATLSMSLKSSGVNWSLTALALLPKPLTRTPKRSFNIASNRRALWITTVTSSILLQLNVLSFSADPLPKPQLLPIAKASRREIVRPRARTVPLHQSHKSDPNHRITAVRAHQSAASIVPDLFLSRLTSPRPPSLRPNRSVSRLRPPFAESHRAGWDSACTQAPTYRSLFASRTSTSRQSCGSPHYPSSLLRRVARTMDRRIRFPGHRDLLS